MKSTVRKSQPVRPPLLVRGKTSAAVGSKPAEPRLGRSRKDAGSTNQRSQITERKQAEETLRESEAQLHAMLDATPFPVALVDAQDNKIEFWSHSAHTLFGHTAPTATEWYEIAYPDPVYRAEVIDRWKPVVEKARQSRQTVNAGEYRVTCRDGSVRICELYASFLGNRLIVTFNDLTERKLAEEALRESEGQYRNVVERAHDGIAIIQDTIIKYLNPSLAELWGGAVDEVIGMPFADYIHPDELPVVLDRYQRRMAGEDVTSTYETALKRKDGSKVYAELNAGTVLFHGERADLAIVRDITERKRSEEQLVVSESRYRALFEDSPISLWEEDFSAVKKRLDSLRADGITDFQEYFTSHPEVITECATLIRVLDVNKTTLSVMGANRKEDLLGSLTGMLQRPVNEGFRDEFVKIAAGETSFHWDGLNRATDGRLINVSLNWSAVPGYEKTLSRVIVSMIDITERKRREEQLAASESRYRALFEDSPISLWEEDFSAVKQRLEALRAAGITDFQEYFTSHPEVVTECEALIKVLDVNKATVGLFGANRKEDFLTDLVEILESQPTQVFQDELVNIAAGKTGFGWEGINKTLDGRLRNIEVGWSVAPGFENSLSKVLISVIDITERKRAEAERQALLDIMQGLVLTDNLQEFLELMHQSLARVIYAENLFVSFHNRSTGLFEEAFFVDKYDAPMPPSKLGRSITSYVFRTGEPLLLNEAKLDELIRRGEVELVGIKPASWLGAPLKTPRETIGVIAIQNYEDPNCYSERDKAFLASIGAQVALAIERKQAEEAFRLAEAKYRGIFENAVEGIFQSNPAGKFITTNPALARMLGYDSPEELIAGAGYLNNGFYVQPERREELMARLRDQEAISGFESEIYRKDGSKMWISENTLGVRDEAGQLYYEGTLLDITKRKRAEMLQDAVYRIASATVTAGSLDDLYAEIHHIISGVMPAENFYITMYDEERDLLKFPYFQDASDAAYLHEAHPEKGLTAYVLRTGKSLLCTQAVHDELERRGEVKLLGTPSSIWLGVPLSIQGKTIGVMVVQHYSDPAAYTEREQHVLEFVSAQVATAIRRKQAEAKAEDQLQRLAALRAIEVAISSSFDLRVTLDLLLGHVTSELGVDAAAVLLLNRSSNELEYAAGHGFRGTGITRMRLKLGDDYPGKAVLERRTLNIPNLAEAERPIAKAELVADEKFVAFFAVPFVAKGQVKGVLELFHRAALDPDPEWLDFLETLAGQAAIAIDNAQLFDELQRSNMELALAYDSTIEGWSQAMDLRDKETEGHTRRVTEEAVKLARAMQLAEQEVTHLRRGALLHDIGKMGVPDAILLKPEPLTDEEWILMKKHPTLAHEMLAHVRYLQPAINIPYCHHEKWDGTGYPRGLKGEQIPLVARIFAVIDVYDALVSDRPYRPAWSPEKAQQHVRSESGKHFDPLVVEAFLNMKAEERLS